MADGNLTIRNIAKADSGDYACSAKKFLGQDFALAQVTVFERLAFHNSSPESHCITVKQLAVKLFSSRKHRDHMEENW